MCGGLTGLSHAVAIDLEFSGLPRNLSSSVAGRRQSVEERYQSLREAAEKFQVLQVGLTTVEVNENAGEYSDLARIR